MCFSFVVGDILVDFLDRRRLENVADISRSLGLQERN